LAFRQANDRRSTIQSLAAMLHLRPLFRESKMSVQGAESGVNPLQIIGFMESMYFSVLKPKISRKIGDFQALFCNLFA